MVKNWIDLPDSALLWLEGPVDCGKTVLVNSLRREVPSIAGNAKVKSVISFFYTQGDEASQSSTKVLCVILSYLFQHDIAGTSTTFGKDLNFDLLFRVLKDVAAIKNVDDLLLP